MHWHLDVNQQIGTLTLELRFGLSGRLHIQNNVQVASSAALTGGGMSLVRYSQSLVVVHARRNINHSLDPFAHTRVPITRLTHVLLCNRLSGTTARLA